MDNLTSANAFVFALHTYTNTSCTGADEFNDDLQRIKYVKRLLRRYVKTGDIKERLLVNHVIGLYNVFTTEGMCRLLFLRVEPACWSALKTVLQFVNCMPDQLDPVNGRFIINSEIPTDQVLLDKLNAL